MIFSDLSSRSMKIRVFMFRRFFLLSLVILSIYTVNAQNRSLTGTVSDQQSKTPLAGASVRLRGTSDSALRQNMVTDSTGTFTFTNLPSDSFLVTISYVGYNAITRGIRIDTTDISIRIGLVPNTSSDLSTVVITARISP